MNSLQSIVFIIPFAELTILYFFSRILFFRLARFLQIFTKKTHWIYYFLAFLFLPGTYIHELAHYLMAKILFVKVTGFSLRPKIIGQELRMGHVEIAKTDFIRRFFIGIAPVVWGSILILGSIYALFFYHVEKELLFIVAEGFLAFEVGNTMFMSKKDMEGAWKMIPFITLGIIIVYLLGIQFQIVLDISNYYHSFFYHISLYLLIPLITDLLLIIFLGLFLGF